MWTFFNNGPVISIIFSLHGEKKAVSRADGGKYVFMNPAGASIANYTEFQNKLYKATVSVPQFRIPIWYPTVVAIKTLPYGDLKIQLTGVT